MPRSALPLLLAALASASAGAAEVTLKNDSLTNFGNASIIWGFVANEMAASWLTSPCDGNLVAVQVFWMSPSGTSAQVIGNAIYIHRSGSFPNPGDLVETIGGPVLTDGVMNEWRYLDENNTQPLSVPVTNGETMVVAFEFAEAPQANVDPSVVRDTDGIQPDRNAIFIDAGIWMSAGALGVTGDWVIRAVVDCQAVATEADVGVTMSADPPAYTAGSALAWTIEVSNAGPAAASSVSLVDIFPSGYQAPTWTCTPSGGATCPAGGSGNIIGTANLPAGASVLIEVNGTVASGFTGTLANTMTAVVPSPLTDPDPANNSVTVELQAASSDLIFRNGFDELQLRLQPVPAQTLGTGWR